MPKKLLSYFTCRSNTLVFRVYSPDLAPNDYWLFADLKKMLQGMRFGSNEEVIAETEAYFENKDESFSLIISRDI